MLSYIKKLFSGDQARPVHQQGHAQYTSMNIPRPVLLRTGDRFTFDIGSETSDFNVYEVVKHIDAGGFGTVYVVSKNNSLYALKVLALWLKLPKEWPDLIKRFESSFRAGQIYSKYIIQYHSKGYLNGNPCIVMEYCGNGNLEDRIKEFTIEQKWKVLGVQLLTALQDLHGSGIIHKDFKPKNILFDENDTPKLTDFDFSAFLDKRNTITRGGRALDLWYTAIYSPPESIDPDVAFEKTSPALDMFSFAVTMYQVISGGYFPYGSFDSYEKDPEGYYKRVSQGDFVPLASYKKDVPPDWNYLLEKCLHPIPEQRIATPAEFLMRLSSRPDIEQPPIARGDNSGKLKPPKLGSLILTAGAGNVGEVFDLNELSSSIGKKIILIGRVGFASDLQIDSIPNSVGMHHISRIHATLKFEDNNWFVSDGYRVNQTGKPIWQPSLNGTEVYNAQAGTHLRLSSGEYYKLNSGDIIHLAGEVTLKYQ